MTTKAPTKKAPAKKATKKAPPAPDQPWDRLPDETDPAYAAFLRYRDLGLARSVTKVATELNKSRTLIGRWSSRHSWALRSSAWDRELDREWQLEQKQARRDAARRNAKLAEGAFRQVAKGLSTLAAGEMDAQAIARLMDAASKLERLALGQSTENVEVSGPDGGPVQTTDLTLLTDEERHARMVEMKAELERRLGGEEGAA